MVLYTFLCPITNSTQLMVPELYFFSHLYFFIFCLIRILTLKSYKIESVGAFFFLLLINPKEYKHLSPRECQNASLPKRILK